jgi:hypothetical protein
MSASMQSGGTPSHPSPHRDRVSLAARFFGLMAGPAAWFGQLVANYALSSVACYPNDLPRVHAAPLWHSAWGILLVINILGMLLALAASFVSWRKWGTTHAEHPGPTSHLLEVGEGRTRFISFVGMMAGLGFFAAILFDTVALFLVPPCIG